MALHGSCLCGGVRFELPDDFEPRAFCHCASCKKLSGGAGTANGRIASDRVTIFAGEELLRTYQPAEGTAKTFCSVCGSNLFGGGWPESDRASVRL
ncbi:MAG TPA: GFA family protein, partial [Gaiellaceae bacterium]|nr:GFA family protein [Gaiellaceae bacterium]